MQLAERCLRVWVESDTDSEQAVMLRDYCQTHWRTHWEAAHPNGPDEERKWPTNEAVFIVRLLVDLCSHSTVEVVLRLVLEKGLAEVVQILSSRNTDQWELAISALGYTHDTPGMDKRLLLICAQVLLAFHRLRDWGGFLITQDDLVYGPIADVLHSTTP
ncbi:hypothetical protein NMY22_g6432 [Coprinellus aureogranulatus]|nr:hypothetical protein NMY22_g6432 [Coprinellus aureogranulatus]